MGNVFKMAQPKIPTGLLHEMFEIVRSGSYDKDKGGQWVPGEPQKIPFKGVVLPVGDEDLARETTGTSIKISDKIYTNGHALQTGAQVFDPDSDTTYTIIQELGHNSLHPMKRYLAEAKGGAKPK